MSGSSNFYPSCLIWGIQPPFVPGETMEAEFFHEAPAVAKWRVTLQLQEVRLGEWDFLLSLVFQNRRHESEEMAINNLSVRISYHKKNFVQEIVHETIPKFIFNAGNGYTYTLQVSTLMFAQTQPHQILIEIRTFLEGDLERPLLPFLKDLNRLSRDLMDLTLSPRFHNVDLHAVRNIMFAAHSYILRVRWKNLFQWPPLHTTAKTVLETEISSYLLRNLLIYLYSGMFMRGFPHWDDLSYVTELFQVIERYDIHHLRDALVKSDSSQLRITTKSSLTQLHDFCLRYVSGAPVEEGSLHLPAVHLEADSSKPGVRFRKNQFRLQIHVSHLNRVGTWLSYSLRSTSNFWAYAQVILEVTKVGIGRYQQREILDKISVHARNYRLGPFESVDSGPVLFLGCLETFADFRSTESPSEIEQWFRFEICLTDGTSVEQFRSFSMSRPSVLTKFKLLVAHMYQLLSQEIHSDIGLVPRSSNGDGTPRVLRVHRAILAARIPRLRDVLVGLQPDEDLPEVAIVDLSDEALPYVLEYVYTGKLEHVPHYLLDEMSDFANRGDIQSLGNLISDILNNYETSVYCP